jgi:Ner family transcriptional regulator
MAKKPTPQDWHKEDIKAAVWKTGTTMKGLALANGYRSVDAVSQALHRPYPKVESIIAKAIGVTPQEIWPSRYTDEILNNPHFCRRMATSEKFNGSRPARNVNLTGQS